MTQRQTLKGRAVEVQVSQRVPLVAIDKPLIEQVLINQLENVAAPRRLAARSKSPYTGCTV